MTHTNIQVTGAKAEHTEAIMNIVEEARGIMRETGNASQWDKGYPSADLIAEDIELGHGFICCTDDGEIVGYFCFLQGEDPDPFYTVIDGGEWLNNAPYGVIHRLASGRKYKGIARAAFNYAFSKINNIRVDTHHENVPMQNFLKKNGFSYCGIIYVRDGTPRDAFQKVV